MLTLPEFRAMQEDSAPVNGEAGGLAEQEREKILRRAYLTAEEARQEAELLYQMSKAVNAAMSYEEIVRAVADVDPQAWAVLLPVWEHFDFERATYLELFACVCRVSEISDKLPQVGQRFPRETFPIAERLSNERLWVIEDTHIDPRVDPLTRANWDAMATRAVIGTILVMNGRWMAGLTFHSSVPRKFTERDRRLFEGIGDLALAAFERIRLQAETEASRHQAELLARVNAALSQADNEQAILSAVYPVVERYDVTLATLAYSRFGSERTVAQIEIVAMSSGNGQPIPPDQLTSRVFQLADLPLLKLAYERPEAPIFVEDVFTDPRHEIRAGQKVAMETGWPTVIAVPLQTGDAWLGVMMFFWKTPEKFSNETRSVFIAIQSAVASVVARRRAYLAEQQRAHELEMVANVSAAAASNLNEEELLDTVVRLTRINLNMQHIFAYLMDESGERLISTDPPKQAVAINDSRALIAHVARMRSGMIIADTQCASAFELTATMPHMRSEMVIPMVVGDRVIGVLDVQSREVNRFTDSDMRVMTTLADLTAVALQNARSYRRAQELAAHEERSRLAHDLHDSVSQALYGIALGARTARALLMRDPQKATEPLDYVLSLAEAGLAEMRALIFELRPGSLEDEGLIAAFNKQAAVLRARYGIDVQIECEEQLRLAHGYEEGLYYIAREALHNIVKHAQASAVKLRFGRRTVDIVLEIIDNGRGFDPAERHPGHLGLHTMHERTTRLGGTLTVESAPGMGTCIRVTLPNLTLRPVEG